MGSILLVLSHIQLFGHGKYTSFSNDFFGDVSLSDFYRYTFFIVLYPIGVSGELLTYWTALKYIERTKMLSIEMPNKYNISFSLWTVILMVMLVYIPRKFIFE